MARIIQNADLDPSTPLTADETAWIYNALDCCVTREVFDVIHPQLDNQTAPVYNLSLALRAPILDMTMRGVLVDAEERERALNAYLADRVKLEEQLNKITRDGIGYGTINPRSPEQLKELLYDYMKLPVQKSRNAQGRFAPTTGRAALEKLQGYFLAQPVVTHILAIRDLGKKIGFLKTGIDPDGRMRASFNIAGTNTGRLASSISEYGTGTNLQNVDRKLRRVFIADRGMKFANIDLEQADSRNVGAVCWNLFVNEHGEAFAGAYLDACESGDLHTTVTNMAWRDLPWPDDRKLWRAIADQNAYRELSYRDLSKKLGHGSNYYGKPPTMAAHSRLPVRTAEDFQHRYFGAFPCIPLFHKTTIAELPTITSLFSRRRIFFGRPNDEETWRKAIAFRGQSPTADEINIGMVELWRANICQLLVQVHDSLLIQYPEELEDEVVPKACELLTTKILLEKGREFAVPVEAKVGWNWGDCEFNKDGSVKANPDGLIKYKGGDTRTRQNKPRKWSLWRQ